MKSITERHQFILRKLQENGTLSIPKLIKEMDVSGVTVRKDLKLLEEKRLLFRTRGGASQQNPYATERPINEKAFIKSEEKKRIAQAALKLAEGSDSIMIGSGTTAYELARILQPKQKLIEVTPALKVALELSTRPNIEVLQLGGLVHHSSSSTAGFFAEKILTELSCRLLFLGVDGIDLDYAYTTTNIMEASLNQKMIALAKTVIVLADSSKFDRRGMGRVGSLKQVDYIVTDRNVNRTTVSRIEKMGVKVLVAE